MIRRWRACQTWAYDRRARAEVARAVLHGRPVMYRFVVRDTSITPLGPGALYSHCRFSGVRFR